MNSPFIETLMKSVSMTVIMDSYLARAMQHNDTLPLHNCILSVPVVTRDGVRIRSKALGDQVTVLLNCCDNMSYNTDDKLGCLKRIEQNKGT